MKGKLMQAFGLCLKTSNSSYWTMTDNLFFKLIQNAVGTADGFGPVVPSAEEWVAMYKDAQKQTLPGVCFAGVQRICSRHPEQAVKLPTNLKMKWLGAAASIQKRNEIMNRHCVELQEMFDRDGIRLTTFKGQSVAALYREDLRGLRQAGDIDIYVECGREKTLEYLRKKGIDDGGWDYVHAHPEIFNDTEVELHYRLSISHNPFKNRKIQKFWKSHEEEFFAGKAKLPCGEIVCPSDYIHLFYLLHHAFRHLISGGIGLRQMMDIYFAIQHRDARQDSRLMQDVEDMGMTRFASATMWVLRTVFALPEIPSLWKADEAEGHFLLCEIMEGGNFGHGDTRFRRPTSKAGKLIEITRRNLHLLSHYESDALAAPFYYIWHFFWKRIQICKMWR